MKIMNKFLTSLTAAACLSLLSLDAKAQATVSTIPLPISVIPAGTLDLTSSNIVLYVANGPTVAIQPRFQLTAPGTTNVVFHFQSSVDGNTWSQATSTVTVTPSGTTVVSPITSLTIGDVIALRLSSIANGNTIPVSNLVIRAAQKNTR